MDRSQKCVTQKDKTVEFHLYEDLEQTKASSIRFILKRQAKETKRVSKDS